VINSLPHEHSLGKGSMDEAAAPPPLFASPVAASAAAPGADRVRAVVHAHYASLWRWLRRLGVPEASVEDAAQRALLVLAQRIDDVELDREKAFLFAVALRVARAVRREDRKWRVEGSDALLTELVASGPDAGEELDDRRARAVLDALLASMPIELRSVFILHELEEMTMSDIARTLEVPPGTVASRLRRARAAFEVLSRRAQARIAAGREGGAR
jgi:RNA polymerase sigma-70 factor (ECF subfamily)